MAEKRSPCLHCERAYENKLKCSKNCNLLAQFQEDLPLVIKFTEEATDYSGRADRRRYRR
jgi:hypothetical protein